jgi:hypothetical protein
LEDPSLFAALFTTPLTSFPSLPIPPNLSFAEAGVLLLVFSLIHSVPKLVGERGGISRLPYTAQYLAQHLVAHAAPTPPVMPAAVVPAVAVPFPLDQPEHLLRVTEVSSDLADVHALPFLDSFRAHSFRTVLLVVTQPRTKSSAWRPRY